jgi:integrase
MPRIVHLQGVLARRKEHVELEYWVATNGLARHLLARSLVEDSRPQEGPTDRIASRENRILNGASLDDARSARRTLQDELEQQLREPPHQRVAEFGRYWLRVKAPVIDPGTHARYKAALEDHAFKHLGRIDMRELRTMQVQEWINRELGRGYQLTTVKGWYRVLRTMTQDAIVDLDLNRDPCRRVRFPVAEEREERNALLPDQLGRFLSAMKVRFPQHHGLAATLALTGLRFCHASALRWEDFDEGAAVLRVRRRQLRGRLGPVTLVKRAPKEVPVSSELMAILSEHRLTARGRRRDRGWMFPSSTGGLRCPSSLHKAWVTCLRAAKIEGRFTVHGMRRTFVDLARRARVDGVVTRSLTGHVTEKMRLHYSTVGMDEKRAAVTAVADLVWALGDREGDQPATCIDATSGLAPPSADGTRTFRESR